jgi:hypothetical protein
VLKFAALTLFSVASVTEDPPDAPDAPDASALDAPALAQKVASATGDIYAVSRLEFTFVVVAGGSEKVRRTHVLDRTAGTLTVTMGGQVTTLEGLHTHDPSLALTQPTDHAAAWSTIAPGATLQAAQQAWSAWINDSYWLLAAGKVLDEGVHQTLTGDGQLELAFDPVGLTPGDHYTLSIDPVTARVTAWDFVRQDGSKGHFTWSDYQTFGPLTFSMLRTNEAGDFRIRFEDIAVSQ